MYPAKMDFSSLCNMRITFTFIKITTERLDFLHEKTRKRQIHMLCEYLDKISSLPLIIMGDFNSQFSRNSALQHLAEKLNLQLWNPKEKIISFPKLRRRLDWILISKEMRFRKYELWDDLASDHLAVRAEIEFLEACVS